MILINQEDYQLALKKFKKCKNIEYVPGVGIDEEKFNFDMSKKEKDDLRKSLGFTDKDYIIIYPAELSNRKRQIWLINALNNLLKENSNIHVLLPGEDSLNGACKKLVSKLELNDQIHLLGYRKDIPKILKIADLAVSSASQEGLPVNIMEAMYVGLPIVASNCRGNRDLVKDGVNGFLVELNDNIRFANCIQELINNKELSNKFSKNNQEIIKDYLLDKILDDMKKIYNHKKKVLHVLASNIYSGAENVACSIIDNLSNSYDMAYCSPDGAIRNILKEKNIEFFPIKKMSVRNLKKIIDKYNPDIIHAHDFKASFVSSCFFKKHKVISHLHKNDPAMKKISIKSILFLKFSKRFYKIVGVSDSIINEYVFKDRIKNKYITLFNYVDKNKILKLSNEFDIEKEYDLFYFGRLCEEKNPIDFIEIIHKLDNNKLNCIMIGNGELKDQCINLIKKYSLENNIEMIGFKSNPFPYIKASKIGIMPSKYEGFGLTAIESLILDKPVYNSGVGGLKEIFKNNTEFICTNIDDYIKKIDFNNIKSNLNIISDKYTDKEKWMSKINKIY